MLLAEQQNGVVMTDGANWTKPLPLLGIIYITWMPTILPHPLETQAELYVSANL